MNRLSHALLIVGVIIFVILTFPAICDLRVKDVRLDMLGFACVFGSLLAGRFSNPRIP